jgi:hypothetical protein
MREECLGTGLYFSHVCAIFNKCALHHEGRVLRHQFHLSHVCAIINKCALHHERRLLRH